MTIKLYNNYKYYKELIERMMNTFLMNARRANQSLLSKQTFAALAQRQSTLVNQPQRNFRQVKNLHEIVWTAQAELTQRTAKYLERTDKVYKPSQTLEFNREGELLLYSCDNIKHSTVYLKYPYIMYDCAIPLSFYMFFINPFGWSW